MRLHGCLAVVLLTTTATIAQEFLPPTTQPFQQAEANRATAALNTRLAQLDVELRAKKSEALQKYAKRMAAVELAAVRSGDRSEAERIYKVLQDAYVQIDTLVPRSRPTTAPASMSFSVTLSDFDGAAGITNKIKLTPSSISVVREDDFGHPPKKVWTAPLVEDQPARLSKVLADLPLDRLQDAYDDPRVNDGYDVTFDFDIAGRKPRKIWVHAARQRDLEMLITQVDLLLPPRYMIVVPGAP